MCQGDPPLKLANAIPCWVLIVQQTQRSQVGNLVSLKSKALR